VTGGELQSAVGASGWVHQVRPLAGAVLGLVLGRNGGEKERSGLLGCTEEKRKEVEGWAGWGIWPKRVLENSKDFSIYYFDSNQIRFKF
jgi:hypothetical protein